MSANSSNSSEGISSCVNSRAQMLIFTSFTVTNISFIPLFVLILFTGWQRWRKQRCRKQRCVSTATQTSHSDVFTYNVTVLELLSTLACGLYCCGAFVGSRALLTVAQATFSFTSPGQSLFHVLTCVERYVAVVHPITYRSLRHSGGVRVRNVSSGCVWLLCFAALIQSQCLRGSTFFIQACVLVSFLVLVSFCSVSVLCALVHAGPRKVDQSKRRAFHTIVAIMGALWLRFLGVLFTSLLTDAKHADSRCQIQSSAAWLTVPGSLVLPLLFLHRAGKLTICRHRSESE